MFLLFDAWFNVVPLHLHPSSFSSLYVPSVSLWLASLAHLSPQHRCRQRPMLFPSGNQNGLAANRLVDSPHDVFVGRIWRLQRGLERQGQLVHTIRSAWGGDALRRGRDVYRRELAGMRHVRNQARSSAHASGARSRVAASSRRDRRHSQRPRRIASHEHVRPSRTRPGVSGFPRL